MRRCRSPVRVAVGAYRQTSYFIRDTVCLPDVFSPARKYPCFYICASYCSTYVAETSVRRCRSPVRVAVGAYRQTSYFIRDTVCLPDVFSPARKYPCFYICASYCSTYVAETSVRRCRSPVRVAVGVLGTVGDAHGTKAPVVS